MSLTSEAVPLPSEASLPEAAALAAALIALKRVSILLTALADFPDLPSPKATAIRLCALGLGLGLRLRLRLGVGVGVDPEQLHLSAVAAVTALACTVREAPGAPPGTAGVVVLPSAPKASATMTLSLRLPG